MAMYSRMGSIQDGGLSLPGLLGRAVQRSPFDSRWLEIRFP